MLNFLRGKITLKEIDEMADKAGVDKSKINFPKKVGRDAKEQIRNLLFDNTLNKK